MGKYELNKNLAQMLKGGVIMDVTNAEQAKIAEAPFVRIMAAPSPIRLNASPKLRAPHTNGTLKADFST